MAAFRQEDYPFFLDTSYFPNSPFEMPLIPRKVGEKSDFSSCFSHLYSSDAIPEISTDDKDKSQMGSHCSMALESHASEKVPKPPGYLEKVKEKRDRTCLSPSQSMGTKERKKRKHYPIDGEKEKEEFEEAPRGYVYLRAKRGQATDSHSLAERARRENISIRMKTLQALVPGCDQVVGKVFILDEIIKYVKNMQNQVEFLSMKLATMNAMLHDFGIDSDACTNQMERSMRQPLHSENEISRHQPAALEDANNCWMMNSSSPFPVNGRWPTVLSQDNGGSVMQVGDHREGFGTQQPLLHSLENKAPPIDAWSFLNDLLPVLGKI